MKLTMPALNVHQRRQLIKRIEKMEKELAKTRAALNALGGPPGDGSAVHGPPRGRGAASGPRSSRPSQAHSRSSPQELPPPPTDLDSKSVNSLASGPQPTSEAVSHRRLASTRDNGSTPNIETPSERDAKVELARRLRADQGMTGCQIASLLGVARSTIYGWLEHKQLSRPGQLNRQAWLDYLEEITRNGDGAGTRQAVTVNGVTLTESQVRARHRWRCEGASPSIWTADEFLTRVGCHIDDFFFHCRDRKLEPWAAGPPPGWPNSVDD